MKVSQFVLLAGERKKKVFYSKDLPHYHLLQIARSGLLVGILVLAIAFIAAGKTRSILLIGAGCTILLSSILNWVVIFAREEKLRHGE